MKRRREKRTVKGKRLKAIIENKMRKKYCCFISTIERCCRSLLCLSGDHNGLLCLFSNSWVVRDVIIF